jgi:iron complex transport system substrate-binding protein
MKKLFLFSSLLGMIFTLASCVNDDVIQTGQLSFTYEENKVTVNFDEVLASKYNALFEALKAINENSKIAVLTSSTANLFFDLGIRMDAIPTSNTLSEGLTALVNREEIVTIGTAYQLNMEILTSINPDVIFMADTLAVPETLNGYHVIQLPQSNYYDIFLTLKLLETVFNASESIQPILKSLAEEHTRAFSYVSEESEVLSIGIVQAIYGQLLYNNNQSLVGSLTSMLPVHNVFGEFTEPYGTLNLEILLSKNPSYLIVHGFGDNPDQALQYFLSLIQDENGLWQSLDAVKNNRIIVLTSQMIGPSSDLRVTKAFLEIARTLYENE